MLSGCRWRLWGERFLNMEQSQLESKVKGEVCKDCRRCFSSTTPGLVPEPLFRSMLGQSVLGGMNSHGTIYYIVYASRLVTYYGTAISNQTIYRTPPKCWVQVFPKCQDREKRTEPH